MPETSERTRRRKLGNYVVVYVLFALLLVLCFFVFAIWQETVVLLIAAFMQTNVTNGAVYSFSVALLGIFLFILAMAAEPYLRGGLRRRQVLPRFARLAVPLAVVAVLGLLLRALASSRLH